MRNNKVLSILGMHRSGTSLVAQWLHACGLHLGDRLLGGDYSNVHGHVEDEDFMELHQQILADNGLDYDITKKVNLKISKYQYEKAKSIALLKNTLYHQWGWKEPRTCLLLNMWRTILPDTHYLIVYRHFSEVVDSLLRRQHGLFMFRRNILLRWWDHFRFKQNINQTANHYLDVWINYNLHLIDFLEKVDRDQFILIQQADLSKTHKAIFDHLRSQWKFELTFVDFGEVYQISSLRRKSRFKVQLQPQKVQEAQKILNQLSQWRTYY